MLNEVLQAAMAIPVIAAFLVLAYFATKTGSLFIKDDDNAE